MKRFIHNNSLSIILIILFLIFLIGLALTGHAHENEQLTQHGDAPQSLGQYLMSGEFYEAVFENWESEFLQMGSFVILTIWLKQKGSADSKKLRGKGEVDTRPRYSLARASNWPEWWRAFRHTIYSNSLTIVLFLIFFVSFALHGIAGAAAANAEALHHGQPTMTVMEYMSSSQFWFESFQNWQSEYIAVAALIILSIFLRQRSSPESKPVADSNLRTGH